MPGIHSNSTDMPVELLKELLDESRLFAEGGVTAVQCEAVGGLYGKSHQLFRLRIESAQGGDQDRPTRLFLKFGNSSKEYSFYSIIARSMTSPPLPRCYHAAYDQGTDQTWLLLEDLSATHFQTEWPLPPSSQLCTRTVQELAKIHALWWQDQRLEGEFRPAMPASRAWIERRALACQKLPEFIGFLSDRLSPGRQRVYERLLALPIEAWEEAESAPQQTLLHGDMHVWNVFYPLDPQGSLYFFDWNMWDIGPPTDDLAYMMAVHWYPERRGRLERKLLEAYHRQLVEGGVTNYTWEDLHHGYRKSIIRSLLTPVWQWVRGIEAGVWWSHLERIFLAYEDWQCGELIGDKTGRIG